MRHGLCLLIPKDKSQAFETVTKKTALNLLYGTQNQEFYVQRGHHPHWIPANPTKNSQSGWAIPPSTTRLSQNHSLANSGKRSAPDGHRKNWMAIVKKWTGCTMQDLLKTNTNGKPC